ncbi:MAG: S8 family serine peptidase [Polyangiaceae bacterium]
MGALFVLSVSGHARADVDVRRALAALPAAMLGHRPERVSLLLERRDAAALLPTGAHFISGNWFALEVAPQLAAQLADDPGLELHWAPPRRLLLDRALGWARVPAFRAAGGGSGRGVVVGVVDSGVDVAHPDFSLPGGGTRLKWLVDFTRGPAGLQPALESDFGCSADASCAIYSSLDIDQLLGNDVAGDEPRDALGHGTHVTSLAAGVAPEADLVVARVANATAGVFDETVARGVKFIFERASELAEPAVVNLSLGSDLGAHDGSSALERVLTEFVGPDNPGRAIVVAAGNSAGLTQLADSPFAGPFGVHTELTVRPGSPLELPIVTPRQGQETTSGGVTVWLATRAGDALEVGVERAGKLLGSAAPSGFQRTSADGISVVVMNGMGSSYGELVLSGACLVRIAGQWPAGETFLLRLSGHASASLWLTGEGDLDPGVSVGPLFPGALQQGTVNVPASAPELIAVGASVNRLDWSDWQGVSVVRDDATLDSMAFYSSAGPNSVGVMKPDLIAPGTNLVGALSAQADPRANHSVGLFSANGRCSGDSECLVVDDHHAVTSGTSMAAPLVTGAVALLFEQEPRLTSTQVRALLQAGARRLEGEVPAAQAGNVGGLDVAGALSALRALDSPLAALPGRGSWLALSQASVRPDPAVVLEGYAELRTDSGQLADAIDARELALRVVGGALRVGLIRVAPALYRFGVSAALGSGGGTLQLRLEYRGATIAERELRIAAEESGVVRPSGGCAFAGSNEAPGIAWLAIAALAAARRRRLPIP